MEVIGIILLVAVILFNAFSFINVRNKQERLYQATATDTDFNKASVRKLT